ncbi:hypothetical protein AX17_007191 [Amanita inopinata Kibby_2008]|nr:hypothetical protein AX17_007191 [Amanita inopinata Kibby_2008]
MSLSLLVPAIINVASSLSPSSSSFASNVPHPLHALLEPLLMPPRAATTKYYVDLPQILAEGGGAGEIEESMMWFALSFEKDGSNGEDGDRELWRNEIWRKGWLEKMERREVQIQVLLHFLKLSLPGGKQEQSSGPTRPSFYNNRGGRRKAIGGTRALSTRDALEAYMDKLSTWQLMQSVDYSTIHTDNKAKSSSNPNDDRDWIQVFAEDVVKQQFGPYLSDLCDLLHTKVFPTSPFSDTDSAHSDDQLESQASTRPNSPSGGGGDVDMETGSGVPRSLVTEAPASGLTAKKRHEHTSAIVGSSSSSSSHPLSRSRSLSVSLQQERESQRGATTAQKSKKRALNREVSMSRVFRAKSKGPSEATALDLPSSKLRDGVTAKTGLREKGHGRLAKGKEKADGAQGIMLVEATPMKSRIRARSRSSVAVVSGLPVKGGGHGGQAVVESEDVDADWNSELPSSTDILVRGPSRGVGAGQAGTGMEEAKGGTSGDRDRGGGGDGMVLVAETPRKEGKIRG